MGYGKFYKGFKIVLVAGFVGFLVAAFLAAVDEGGLFGGNDNIDGGHEAMAEVGAVAGVVVYMEAVKTMGAVVGVAVAMN